MKSFKELLTQLKQKKLSFATKQWIIIIVAVLLGVCMSDLNDYLYRNNDAFRYNSEAIVLIGEHQLEGAKYGLKFALVAVILNILYRNESEPRKKRKEAVKRKVLRTLGITFLVLFTLILWLLIWLDGLHPDTNYIFYIYFVLYILLRKEAKPYWITVLSIFVITAVWFVFFSNNVDIHPIRVAHDSIQSPNEYHLPRFCFGGYGLYWCGRVIAWTSIFGGIASIAILILMKVIRTLCDDCKKVVAFFKAQKEPEKPEPKPRLDHSLERFVVAQERMYSRALEEVKNGKKLTHWIWYIFPQLKGLGHSNKSIYYGLDGIEEARAYLAHPILGTRLREITTTVLQSEKSADEIFGGIDTIKLRSCMTLFNEVAEDDLFGRVLLKCFEGEGDSKTKMMTNTEVKIDCL